MSESSESGGCVQMWRTASYYWSVPLCLFSFIMVIYGIAKEWNNPPWIQDRVHPVFEIFIFLLLLFWISLLEGAQISIVGLQGINLEAIKDSHPRAYELCKVVHAGPNVERFLVGRQFLLLFCGFLVSRLGGAGPESPDQFKIGDWEWNVEASQFFWSNSVLLMIVIIAPGQLTTQLMAADKMLGFFNLPLGFMYTIVYPCLGIEWIGLTHSSYFLKDVLIKVFKVDKATRDPNKKMNKDWFYYVRVLISVSAVIFSGIFLFKGLFARQTAATDGAGWSKLPGYGAFLVSLLFLFIMGCAEGLQVSALALIKTSTSTFKDTKPLAYKTCKCLFEGRNMSAFLVGRQFMVAMMMVLLGRVLSYAGSEGELIRGSDWGMGAGFNEGLLQTGFLGAILVVNVAQLMPQVSASIFPVAFINNHFLYYLLQLMLLIEFSGIVNACWPFFWGLDKLFGMAPDPFEMDSDPNVEADLLKRKTSMGLAVEKKKETTPV